jgi:DNA polymerase-3 subunit beta
MKFTIKKSDIVDVLAKIQGLTGRRSSLAITECVLLQAFESSLVVTATDLETGYRGKFEAQVEKPGVIAINSRKLFEIVREFPSDHIVVEESENHLINIGKQKLNYHLLVMNADDFPPIPELKIVDFIDLNSEQFKKMIDKSIIISGIGEDKKPHINGVWLEWLKSEKPPIIRMVSTDGSRLSKYDLAVDSGKKLPETKGILIPKKGLHEISKFLGRPGSKAQIGVIESYFVIKSDFETLHVRLLEGKFPKYDEIVIRQDGHKILIDKEYFINMLKRMAILCTETYRAAIFKFDQSELVINATNPEIGESKEDMAIDYDGETIETAFNPRFFIEAINCIDDDKLVVNLLSDTKPCLIEGSEDKSYLSAIMPMRV